MAKSCVTRAWLIVPASMLAVLMPVFAGMCQTCAGPDDEVHARLKQWIETFNTNNADGLAQLYDQDARLFSTGGSEKPLDGREAIRDYFAPIFKSAPSSVAIDHDDVVQLFSDVAVETGFYHFDVRDPEGKPLTLVSRYTFVFVKKDGSWTIVHHHSSRVPQLTAAPAK